MAWSKINDPKQLGGLGVGDLKDFNTAMVAKKNWRLLKHPHSLFAKLFKVKYYPKSMISWKWTPN